MTEINDSQKDFKDNLENLIKHSGINKLYEVLRVNIGEKRTKEFLEETFLFESRRVRIKKLFLYSSFKRLNKTEIKMKTVKVDTNFTHNQLLDRECEERHGYFKIKESILMFSMNRNYNKHKTTEKVRVEPGEIPVNTMTTVYLIDNLGVVSVDSTILTKISCLSDLESHLKREMSKKRFIVNSTTKLTFVLSDYD